MLTVEINARKASPWQKELLVMTGVAAEFCGQYYRSVSIEPKNGMFDPVIVVTFERVTIDKTGDLMRIQAELLRW